MSDLNGRISALVDKYVELADISAGRSVGAYDRLNATKYARMTVYEWVARDLRSALHPKHPPQAPVKAPLSASEPSEVAE